MSGCNHALDTRLQKKYYNCTKNFPKTMIFGRRYPSLLPKAVEVISRLEALAVLLAFKKGPEAESNHLTHERGVDRIVTQGHFRVVASID